MRAQIQFFLVTGRKVLCALALGGVLILLCVGTLSGCVSSQLMVGQREFVSIRDAETLESVKKQLGSGMRHSFTVCREGHEWRMFRCRIRCDDKPVIDLLFRDGKFCNYIKLSHDDLDRMDTDSHNDCRSKTGCRHPLDYTHIDRALESECSRPSVLDLLKPRNDTSYALLPVLVIMLPELPEIMWQSYMKDSRHLAAIRELDGNKFSVGDHIDKVLEELGKPMRKKTFDDGTECLTWVRTYRNVSARSSLAKGSLILVVVVVNDRVEAVYSRDGEPCDGWLVSSSWWD